MASSLRHTGSFVAVRRLLSSCGARVPQHTDSVVGDTQAL